VHLIYKIGLVSLATSLFAYYGKVEPINSYTIKSDVSGKVVDVNRSAVATNYKDVVIKIDKDQDEINLKNYENQVKNLESILDSQLDIMKRKKAIYKSYKNLKSKSSYDKNLKFFDYQNSLISYNQTRSSWFNSVSNRNFNCSILRRNFKIY